MKKIVMLVPILTMAFEPVLVSKKAYQNEPLIIYSANKNFYALVTYGIGNSEFVPFDQFILRNKNGKTIYTKSGFNHTVVDIGDNGYVVGADFDGPISGYATLHFYNPIGVKTNTAFVGFLGPRAFSDDGSIYCVMDGINGLRVFSASGQPLYNLGLGNSFAISSNGLYIALAKDEEIILFQKDRIIGTIPIFSPFIRQMKFSKDASLLCYIDRKNVYVYRISDQQLIFNYKENRPERNLISFDINPDNTTIIAGLDEDYGRNTGKGMKKAMSIFFKSTMACCGRRY